ncbi:acyltransferase [Hydrotalea sp.]|uniref:acyltransferase n=1 Tax=Hydrotalea sp. TaxID=2881279 RepID=UPI003D0E2417
MRYKFFWAIRTLYLRFFFKGIGAYCYIGKPTYILNARNIKIGKKVRIFPGMRIESHNNGTICICDDVSIGQNFHLICSKNKLIIGAHTTISANVFITNIDHDYQKLNVHILKQDYLEKETQIGENCFIGYGAVIQAGTILGKQCVVGANSVVRGKFPDYCIIVGIPAKIVKRYNCETMRWEKTDFNGNFILI